MNGDLPREIALGDGCRDQSDVPHLRGEPVRHRVDGIGQVLPRTRHSTHLGLTAELALRAHFAGDPGHLVGERRQLVDQAVDGAAHLQELAAQRVRRTVRGQRPQIHPLLEVALGHRREHAAHLGDRSHQVVDERVRPVDGRRPSALARTRLQALGELALAPHHPPDPGDLTRELQIAVGDLVEDRGDLRHHAVARDREALPEVPVPHGDEARQKSVERGRVHFCGPVRAGTSRLLAAFRARACTPRRCARLHRVPPARVDRSTRACSRSTPSVPLILATPTSTHARGTLRCSAATRVLRVVAFRCPSVPAGNEKAVPQADSISLTGA